MVWYCTREDVKTALQDTKSESSVNNAAIDRAIEDGSRSVEKLCHRVFYPELDTRYFDYPPLNGTPPWKLYLNEDEIISLTSATAGGATVTPSDINLEPVNAGPPYLWVELNRSSASAWGTGTTSQRNIALSGLFGYRDDAALAGTLAVAISSASATTLQCSDSSLIGVGDVIKIDSERMIVTAKNWVTSGQTLQTPMTADKANRSLAVTSGAALNSGENVVLDTEQMSIQFITANTAAVKRAEASTVLATHTGSTVYVPRTLTVQRGALGTTAATHLINAPISKLITPVKSYVVGYAMNQVAQEQGAYGATGSGATERASNASSLAALAKEIYNNYGRKGRSR